MNLKVSFHRAASKELVEASVWYESKRLGLAIDFLAEIDRCLLLAAKNPHQFVSVYEDVRRIVVKRFPYSVYFRAERHRIVVLAVFHSNRNPTAWLSRV